MGNRSLWTAEQASTYLFAMRHNAPGRNPSSGSTRLIDPLPSSPHSGADPSRMNAESSLRPHHVKPMPLPPFPSRARCRRHGNGTVATSCAGSGTLRHRMPPGLVRVHRSRRLSRGSLSRNPWTLVSWARPCSRISSLEVLFCAVTPLLQLQTLNQLRASARESERLSPMTVSLSKESRVERKARSRVLVPNKRTQGEE